MRVLLSTIGSRGDVQPLVALALELKALTVDVRLCVPPDFREWLESLGLAVTPIGPELRATAKPAPPPSAEERLRMIEGTVVAQFETIAAAAQDCDAIVGATALQIAAPSIAESLRIPYVFAAYCPAVLPSPHHAPLLVPRRDGADHQQLWEDDARQWNTTWGALLNAQRAKLGLAPVSDVRGYVLTDAPWLAADPLLAPWPDGDVYQPGAWLFDDDRPLDAELEAFLDDGEPPVYFGFGSIRAPEGLAQTMIEAARANGHRALLSRGWAGLSSDDAFVIEDVNHQKLFPRVAAVVHHGGAGTTTAAARAGAPQVIIPQRYDQPYWAQRVRELGIGTDGTDSLSDALRDALRLTERARSIAPRVRTDGARIAAQRLVNRLRS